MSESPARPPTAEERGHSLELVTMTAIKTVPDKHEGAAERRKKSEREMPALLVKIKTRRHKRSIRVRQADGTENCCDVGRLPDRTVVSIWRKRRIVRNTSNRAVVKKTKTNCLLVRIDGFVHSRITESDGINRGISI
jgi:hypothetical protein